MDVSNILATHAAKYGSTEVEKETPLIVDSGFLTVTDLNPIDPESYNADLEAHLQNLAREGAQSLFAALFTLPTRPSPDGPLAQLPPPITHLPRAKPLPKPKPPTKWEKFAAAKGIQHKVRDKKVWDEEKQDWVNRWGRDGKNREKEEQWITEVPLHADVDHDPAKIARDERKARVAKNERQRAQNTARASKDSARTPANEPTITQEERGISASKHHSNRKGPTGANAAAAGVPSAAANKKAREERKTDISRTLATSRVSTASMGKYDKKLEGEKKIRGVKRKFEPTERPLETEKKASLALISRLDSDAKKTRREPAPEENVLNTRKAVRFASKGRGGAALGREVSKGGRSSRGRGSGGRGRGR